MTEDEEIRRAIAKIALRDIPQIVKDDAFSDLIAHGQTILVHRGVEIEYVSLEDVLQDRPTPKLVTVDGERV